MSTKIEAENIVQSLLNGVNEVTGNQDTNLTDGINSLIEGYGQGGSVEELPAAEEASF